MIAPLVIVIDGQAADAVTVVARSLPPEVRALVAAALLAPSSRHEARARRAVALADKPGAPRR